MRHMYLSIAAIAALSVASASCGKPDYPNLRPQSNAHVIYTITDQVDFKRVTLEEFAQTSPRATPPFQLAELVFSDSATHHPKIERIMAASTWTGHAWRLDSAVVTLADTECRVQYLYTKEGSPLFRPQVSSSKTCPDEVRSYQFPRGVTSWLNIALRLTHQPQHITSQHTLPSVADHPYDEHSA